MDPSASTPHLALLTSEASLSRNNAMALYGPIACISRATLWNVKNRNPMKLEAGLIFQRIRRQRRYLVGVFSVLTDHESLHEIYKIVETKPCIQRWMEFSQLITSACPIVEAEILLTLIFYPGLPSLQLKRTFQSLPPCWTRTTLRSTPLAHAVSRLLPAHPWH